MSTLSVPNLAAAAGPVLEFERRILDSVPEIEHWFRLQWLEHTPPFYGSVDLRNAGFKLAPVDMNLFPGGFNNLSDDALPCAVQAAQVAVERICPDARRLLLVPERHTRNVHYLLNVARLVRILSSTGLEVRIGSLAEELTEPTTISLPGAERLLVEPLPDQTLLPPLHAGWSVRRKSNHFACYDEVAGTFARLVQVDPWMINPLFARCGEVDFRDTASNECLVSQVDQLLAAIREKYQTYDIQQKPFVIVKADAGTYGMGIMTVHDASEVAALNRKQRNKMAIVKEGLHVSEVIIQEGVPSFEKVEHGVAEPVVYMIDRYVVGGFYRVHPGRGIDENLNAPGMHFVPLAFHCSCNLPDPRAAPGASALNRFYIYGVIGRLALLAAALELERWDPANSGATDRGAPTSSTTPALAG
ncbi:Glutamate--cysteine ligase [Burkholderiales bacterium]|nr:Glutamate--cysteine ligase [Burkholderiales bacterium]